MFNCVVWKPKFRKFTLHRSRTNNEPKRKNSFQEDSPTKKKGRLVGKMKDDARDSLAEFQSSIFDASDGHKLVDFIRKKKGLRAQPQQIFDEVRSNRESLQIEIQKLIVDEGPLEPEKTIETEARPESPRKADANEPQSPRKLLVKSPAIIDAKHKLKRLSHIIGRRTLIKEFERTLHESRFLPATCSTPLSIDSPNSPTCSWNTPKAAPNTKSNKTTVEKSTNVNLVCTPITITDNDSPQNTSTEHKKGNKTLTPHSNTEDVMRDLQKQNDLLLHLADSEEEEAAAPNKTNVPLSNEQDKENPPNSPNRRPPILNSTSTPIKSNPRRTFTVHHESSIRKSVKPNEDTLRPPSSPNTPDKDPTNRTRKLIVTPKQKQLLLSRFNHDTSLINTSLHKTSPIPDKRNITIEPKAVDPGGLSNLETAYISQNTAQIIEQLQKKTPSNAPIIVIPVNQTFNQGSRDKSPACLDSTRNRNSSIPHDVTAHTAKPVAQTEPIVTPSFNQEDVQPINNSRLEDIITDDESSNSSDNEPIAQVRLRNKSSRSGRSVPELSTRSQKQLSLSETQTQRNSSHRVREVIKPDQLSKMNIDDILDLRKRNSRGELRRTLQLSQRESSMLEKQVELELLKRNIHDNNYEDEVLHMEVLPPPPEEFSDERKSSNLNRSFALPTIVVGRDLDDEMSSDRISLSQDKAQKLSKSVTTKKKRKTKRIEEVERYLEASQMVTKSKYLNLSKRKLYYKGHSDATSSDDSSHNSSLRRRNTPISIPGTPRKRSKKVSAVGNDFVKNPKSPVVVETKPINQPPSKPDDCPIFKKPIGRPRKKNRPKKTNSHVETVSHETTQSTQQELFIPDANETLKKPVEKSSKKNPNKSKLQVESASGSSTSTSRERRTRNVRSPSPSFSPPPPVDPVSTTNNISVRRSSRERKPLTAYWSCSQKEYWPLYNIQDVYKIKISSLKKKSKDLPGSKDNLVENTKAKKSNSVNKVQEKKKYTKKQQKDHNSNALKQKQVGKSKGSSTMSTNFSECPSYHSSTSDTSNCPPRLIAAVDESNLMIRQHDSDDMSDSNDSGNGGTTATLAQLKENNAASSECEQRDMLGKLAVIAEDVEVDGKDSPKLADSEDYPAPERRGRKAKKTTHPLIHTRPSTKKQDNNIKSKLEGKKQKAIISSAVNQSTISDCRTNENASSVQQARLATIAENSIPELAEHSAIGTSASDKENDSQSGNKLMKISLLNIERKKLNVHLKNTNKMGSFRREHDESIADVSSVHVHKLFDQLKSSSLCVATDVTAQQVSCSGQDSLSSRMKNQIAAVPKLKNLAVRVKRIKNKEDKSLQNKDKVCDSGFSSEDMSSDPKQKGDILLNWLKQIVRIGRSPSGPHKGVARFLQSDGFQVASVDELIFEEIDGIEYAFYNTQTKYSFGYIRFNPNTEKKKCTAKKFELSFCIICGGVKIIVNGNSIDCNNGDLVTVFKGTSYGIKNFSNEPALVMVIKK